MIRATASIVLLIAIATPALAQDATRVGAVSLAYVARSSKAGKAALAEIEKFVKQKEAEGSLKAAELEKQRVEFRVRLAPIIDAVSKEKGLQFVFGLEQAAIVWWSPAVDISEDVVKRLDAGK